MNLNSSSKYRSWIKSRDRVLEEIRRKYIHALNRGMDLLLKRVLDFAIAAHIRHGGEVYEIRRCVSDFESRLDGEFDSFLSELNKMIARFRKITYAISYLGQAEAIGIIKNKNTIYDITKQKIADQKDKPMLDDQHYEARTYRAMAKLKRDLVSKFESSILTEENLDETVERIKKAWPKKRAIRRLKPTLKPLQEAQSKDKSPVSFSFGFIDDETFDALVDDYKNNQIPYFGGREGGQEADDFFDKYGKYEWEFEQEISHDFIQQVRDGEIDAAKKNGITDFVWIAILDDKTDECCRVRDGLTTREIEDQLDSGKIDKEECDAIVPPAHFNCRCRIAPYAKDIEEFENVKPDFAAFDDWLNAKAREK